MNISNCSLLGEQIDFQIMNLDTEECDVAEPCEKDCEEYCEEYCKDEDECESCSNVGLIVAVSILAALLALAIIGFVAAYFLLFRYEYVGLLRNLIFLRT